MTIANARFVEFAIPTKPDCEISKAYWQTATAVSDIAENFGLSGSGKVNSAVCDARLNGIVCSGCDQEMVVNTRSEAAGPISLHLRGRHWDLKKIQCETCRRAEKSAKDKAMVERWRKVARPADSKKDEKAEFYLSWEWRTLRTKVLHQYGARCMCCGATPEHKTVGGEPVVIVVDHIKPLSKHWDLRLDRGNLQILCQECNQGKGAWDETDYRPVPKTEAGDTVQ